MPEILYRDDVNRFSVYRLADIPDEVPCSGATSLHHWKSEGASYIRGLGRGYFESRTRSSLIPRDGACVAVLDEHAEPLKVQRIVTLPIEILAVDFHRGQTDHLGAQHGERRPGLNRRESAAWSAHLRCLVNQSTQREREHEATMSGWDPYGDD